MTNEELDRELDALEHSYRQLVTQLKILLDRLRLLQVKIREEEEKKNGKAP